MRSRVLLLLAVVSVVACTPTTRPPAAVPDALASFVVWREEPLTPASVLDGSPVDTLVVEPGQIVRVEVPSGGSIDVIEGAHTANGVVESRRTEPVQSGAVIVRAGAFTTAFAFARGAVRRAFIGHGSDPGVNWIEHTRRVVAWAEGPIPAPFPEVVPVWRVDRELFDRLDNILAADITRAPSASAPRDAARAIRAVVGLRQLRAVQPVSGYPYFLDAPAIAKDDAAAGAIEGHDVHRVEPGKPLKARATGPATLTVWAWSSDRGPERTASITVIEGEAPRATMSRRLRRAAGSSPAPSSPERLMRTVVHVPPGDHTYRIESDGALLVAAIAARPVLPMDLASRGEERALLARAARACDADTASATCQLARALATPSMEAPRADAVTDEVSRLAGNLGAGRPHDAVLDRGVAGDHADAAAFDALEREVAASVDETTRSTWIHAIQRASTWRPLPGPATDRRWTVALRREDGAAPTTDNQRAEEPRLILVGKEATTITSTDFHDTTVIDLVWAGAPSAKRVQLEVDGQRISALPHAAYARWHVRVRGEAARVRRLDDGPGEVFSAAPSMRLANVAAAVTEDAQEIVPSAQLARGIGVELWAREDRSMAEVDVEASHGRPGHVLLQARGTGSALAIDEAGHRWRRVARAALPTWAAQGARLRPRDGTAYRAIVREASEPPETQPPKLDDGAPPPPAPSLEAIVALSREVLATDGPARAAALRDRAIALAERGARTAALRDARAAITLGLDAERARTIEADIERIASRALQPPAPLPPSVAAYGIEPDFDDEGTPRAAFERALAEIPPRDATTSSAFDPDRAARVIKAARAVPLDPRSLRAIHRALTGAHWQTLPNFAQLDHERNGRPAGDTVADGDGLLLPRVATGMPFPEASFVAITTDRPSAFRFMPNGVGARYHLDVVCTATVPDADVNATCTPRVLMGEETLAPSHGPDHGRTRYDIPPVKRPVRVQITVDDAPSRWVALAQLVSDRKVLGAELKTPEGWVVLPPRRDAPAPIGAGRYPVDLRARPSILRVRATTDRDEPASVTLEVDGTPHAVPSDGTDLVVPVRSSAVVVVSGGRARVNVAERVPSSRPPYQPSSAAVSGSTGVAAPPPPSIPVTVVFPPSAGEAIQDWSSIARRSPRPLTAFESNLGTFVVSTGAVIGTLQRGAPAASRVSSFGFLSAGYRRRIERLKLWTDVDGFMRLRAETPATYGANVVLYEDLDVLHVRLSGSVGVASQRVLDGNAVAWLSHGFAEYSWRVTPNFFIVPRIGWDYVGMSLPARPRVAPPIDNDVWNSYRSNRSTFFFAQSLFWWVPYFDQITYLRMRITGSPSDGAVARVAARPGAFAVLGSVDLAAYVDAAWISASQSIRGESRLAASTGIVCRYDIWSRMGSLDIQPGVAAFAHLNDGAWQVNLFVNLFASHRRGLRDFSSLELDFPEQRSDGIPWRGNNPGAYR
jgi:hypothetical protein